MKKSYVFLVILVLIGVSCSDEDQILDSGSQSSEEHTSNDSSSSDEEQTSDDSTQSNEEQSSDDRSPSNEGQSSDDSSPSEESTSSDDNQESSSETGVLAGITDAHNRARANVGVSGLTWSNTIASFAKEWADYLAQQNNCKMKHRPSSGSYAQKYGENIYWASALSSSDGTDSVQDISSSVPVTNWDDEKQYYDYESNSCQSGQVCGHYTQVVWAESKTLGCAMTICPDKGQIWVCNYDPRGNIVGQKPY